MLMVLLSIRDEDHSHKAARCAVLSRTVLLAFHRWLLGVCSMTAHPIWWSVTYRHELRACCLFRHSRAYREHRIANGAPRMSNPFRDFASPLCACSRLRSAGFFLRRNGSTVVGYGGAE